MILGIHKSTREGMIFGFIENTLYCKVHSIFKADYQEENWINWIWKPLFDCPTCMSSFWGTVYYYIAYNQFVLTHYFVFIFALCGLNWIVYSLILNKLIHK